jgi:hypothetical protein
MLIEDALKNITKLNNEIELLKMKNLISLKEIQQLRSLLTDVLDNGNVDGALRLQIVKFLVKTKEGE